MLHDLKEWSSLLGTEAIAWVSNKDETQARTDENEYHCTTHNYSDK